MLNKRKHAIDPVEAKPRKSTLAARGKVAALLEFMRGIQTLGNLNDEIAAGLTLDWEGLRKKAKCGSDALHKHNDDLKTLISEQRSRLIGLSTNDRNKHRRRSEDDFRDELKSLKVQLKKVGQELELAHLTNLELLSALEAKDRKIEHLTKAGT